MSPLQALYGRPPPSIAGYSAGSTKDASSDSTFTMQAPILPTIKANLFGARQRMTQQANTHRRDKSFSDDNWVYLKLQTHQQRSVHSGPTTKLTQHFYGPFCILRRIGPLLTRSNYPQPPEFTPFFTYHSSSPVSNSRHSRFALYPKSALGTVDPLRPVKVLASRSKDDVSEVLVQWKGLPSEEESWVPSSDVCHFFPSSALRTKLF
ncbi:UNVERIFIED_CONTAM: hypothetical protein Slati_2187500 [Sesamum latifolium]|uniref:Chromo domain-containing protein n=1 Tax=Sesamum latifolium TaxID=2727402 RepID=A0AAW2WTB9_9LAMI